MKDNIKIMGGNIHFEISSKKKSIEKEIFDFCEVEINRLVNIFNFFDKNSDLSKLNIDKKVKFSKELSFLLEESIKLYELTNGLFNIFLGNEILSRKNNKKSKVSNYNFNNISKLISFDSNFIYFNSQDLKIDLGGIAKGFIVDELIKLVKKKFGSNLVSILIDARGDIGIFSKSKESLIGISDPLDDKKSIEIIKLKIGNIITSGHNKQVFEDGSHIIGNREGILTITLVSKIESCYFLDTLGTYFMQLGCTEVFDLIEFDDKFKDVECLVILENSEIIKSGFFEMYTNG